MVENIEAVRPFLLRGVPELDIQSIDPIDTDDLRISGGARSTAIHVFNRKNRVFGISSFKLKKLE